MEHCELLHECGFIKPIHCVSIDDKCAMVQALTLQFVLLQCKAELDQFIEGLKVVGVLDAIREHHSLLRQFFCRTSSQLSVGTIIAIVYLIFKCQLLSIIARKVYTVFFCVFQIISASYILKVTFSEKGSSSREREEATYMNFLTYLQNCEKSK